MTACNRGPWRTYGQELKSGGVPSHTSTEDSSSAGAVTSISLREQQFEL